MDTSLSILPSAGLVQAAPSLPRAVTTRVQVIEPGDEAAILPSNKPFVAQVVSAQLAGTDQSEPALEPVRPERTLRPYDVPMLPYESEVDQIINQQTTNNSAASAKSSPDGP